MNHERELLNQSDNSGQRTECKQFNSIIRDIWNSAGSPTRHHGSDSEEHDTMLHRGFPSSTDIFKSQTEGEHHEIHDHDQERQNACSEQPSNIAGEQNADPKSIIQFLQQIEQEIKLLEEMLAGSCAGGSNTPLDISNGGTTPSAGDGNIPTNGGTTPSAGDGNIPTNGGTTPSAGDGNIPTNGSPPRGDGPTPAGAAEAIAGANIPSLPDNALNAQSKFGATGDGTTNDTKALQSAIDACPPGGTVYIPNGTYMVDVKNGGVKLKSGVTIQMAQGATLKAITSDTEGGSVLNVSSVSDVNIYGGTIQGDRATHQGNWGECEYGIGIYGSSNVNVVGVTSKDNFGDGFCVDEGKGNVNSTNIHLSHDVGINNRRDGLSIVGVNGMTVTDSVFSNNGGNDSIDPSVPDCPQLPMSGIDIEPDPGKTTVGITIQHNRLENNATACSNVADNGNGFGLRLTGGQGTDTGNKILDNTIRGNAKGGIGVWTGDQTISGNDITQDKNGYIVYGGSANGEDTLNGTSAGPSHG